MSQNLRGGGAKSERTRSSQTETRMPLRRRWLLVMLQWVMLRWCGAGMIFESKIGYQRQMVSSLKVASKQTNKVHLRHGEREGKNAQRVATHLTWWRYCTFEQIKGQFYSLIRGQLFSFTTLSLKTPPPKKYMKHFLLPATGNDTILFFRRLRRA